MVESRIGSKLAKMKIDTIKIGKLKTQNQIYGIERETQMESKERHEKVNPSEVPRESR